MFCEEEQEKNQCFCVSSALYCSVLYFHNFVLFLLNGLRRVAQSVGIYSECQQLLSVSYPCRE